MTTGSQRNERNTAGCCDGRGQVHHGEGALSFVTLCHNAECVERRAREWDAPAHVPQWRFEQGSRGDDDE